MIIASIPLPYHLRPSILSLSRWIDSERFILFSDDMNIHVIKWNPFIPQVCSVDSLNALSYDMVEGGSIAAALYPNYLSIQQNGTSLSIRLTSEVSKLSLFKYDKSNYCIFLYGSTTVETYYLLENGTVVTSPPICLSSKCELVNYSHGILFTVLIDGSLVFWSLDPNDKWIQLGSELFNTYRITDICCTNFPEIVITTWEGTIYLKLYSQHSVQGCLKPIATIEPRSEIQPGECCGTFVKYNAQSKMYVISRAVSNEIIIYNQSFDTALLSIHLPTFFRGLLLSPSGNIPVVIGLTNDSIYAFHLPPILYLQKSPISIQSITNVVTKNLPWLYLQGVSDQSLSCFEILNHCVRFGDHDKKVFYFSKKLLDVLLLKDNFILIGFSDSIVIVDMDSQRVVHQLTLNVPSIREMRFCMNDCCNVYIIVSHVLSDLSVVMSTSTIQFECKNDSISILQSPHFTPLSHDSRKSILSICNIPILFNLIDC